MSSHQRFDDRRDAGRFLATLLSHYRHRSDVLVLALPRGGVPVAAEVAWALHVSLDILLVRKLGVPGQKELALGAIASGGVRILNHELIDRLGITLETVEAITVEELEVLNRLEAKFQGTRPSPVLNGRTVMLIDDGLATGATMRSAVAAVRSQTPASIVVAVPVGARDTCEQLRLEADEVVCAWTPERFNAVGAYYEDFSQTTDDEVRQLLMEHSELRMT